ncbi:hypothetical protein EVC28_064 [Rhizobium phage RHph_I1_23]|nr:hypothetical protein EVC28_064 [Rhizobium phage RHph_I1_23]
MTLKLDDGEKAGFDILCEAIPADLAEDVIRSRRKKKAIMTARIAKRLVEQYRAYGNPERAAEIHVAKGWVDFQSAWAKKGEDYRDTFNPTPVKETREEYIRRSIARNNEDWESNDRARQARNVISLATRQ